MKHHNEKTARSRIGRCGELCSFRQAAQFMVTHCSTIGEDVTVWDVYVELNALLLKLKG